MNRGLRLAYSAVGLLLMVLSLPGLGSDINGWAAWLDWIDEWMVRWAFLIVGLAIIVAVNFGPPIQSWFQRQRRDLVVTITHEDWDNFQYLALILELSVTIRNRADRRKSICGYRFQHSVSLSSAQDMQGQLDAQPEAERRKKMHQELSSVIEPKSTVSGWLVFSIPWPGANRPGAPTYTLSVMDELNETYEAKRKLR